jgi:hypothetical protein
MSVLFRFYDRNLFEHSLARSLNNAYKHSHTSTYSINGKPVELDHLIQCYKNREYKQTILLDDFRSLAKLIATHSPECKGNELKAALLLIYDVLIDKE